MDNEYEYSETVDIVSNRKRAVMKTAEVLRPLSQIYTNRIYFLVEFIAV